MMLLSMYGLPSVVDRLLPATPIVYFSVMFIISLYGFHKVVMIWRFYKYRRKCKAAEFAASQAFTMRDLPPVTIQLPIYNELYVVERLLDAIAHLKYPLEKLEIQVLDDSTDETQLLCRHKVKALQNEGYNIVYLQRPSRKGFKAGALDYGLQQASGELVMIFDADFVPMSGTLLQMVDYFADPAVGMVQARWAHLNRQYSLLTEIQALMLDGHFVIEQTSRSQSGCFFNFNGTAGVWRKSAIADAGGWQHTTVTEDLDLSYRVQLKGWRCLYLPHIVVPAELPMEMNAFKSQQFRWAKGASQVARKLLGQVFCANVPFYVKCEAFFHLTNNFNYLLMMVLLLLSFPYQLYIAQYDWQHGPLVYLPILGITTLNLFGFYWVSQREQRSIAKPMQQGLVSPWQLIYHIFFLLSVGIGMSLNQSVAVCDGFWGAGTDFVRTPKHGIIRRTEKWTTKKYRGAKTWVLCLELLMLLYLAATIAFALAHAQYSSLPFLTMFLVGYSYVLALGLFQRR